MPWQTLNTPVDVRITSWHRGSFIHYRKSVTSNTFQFRDDSESKSAINKAFCGHRIHWFKKIKSDLFSNAEWNDNREREKSKYLDNISVLPTSIFIFDKFVNGTQPEVAWRNRRSLAHFENPVQVTFTCPIILPLPIATMIYLLPVQNEHATSIRNALCRNTLNRIILTLWNEAKFLSF
jgi:hypothetical protein